VTTGSLEIVFGMLEAGRSCSRRSARIRSRTRARPWPPSGRPISEGRSWWPSR